MFSGWENQEDIIEEVIFELVLEGSIGVRQVGECLHLESAGPTHHRGQLENLSANCRPQSTSLLVCELTNVTCEKNISEKGLDASIKVPLLTEMCYIQSLLQTLKALTF